MKNNNVQFQNVSLLVLRLIIASIFIYSTFGKWQYLSMGAPGLSPFMVGLTYFLMVVEPLGALALIGGYLTKWAAAGLGIIMVGAVFMLSIMYKTAVFTFQTVGLDYNLLILGGCLILVAFGAGKWSIDSNRGKK